MKALVIALIVAMTPVAQATAAPQKDWKEVCEILADRAEGVMIRRQNGESMASVVKLAGGNEILESMVVEAYDTSRYQTASVRQSAIVDFRDRWYVQCAKTMRAK